MTPLTEMLTAAMNAHDLDRMVDLFEPGYRSEQPVHPGRGFSGFGQVRDNWSAIFAGIPDLRVELVSELADGTTSWSEWHWWGTRVDGSPVDIRGVVIFGLREGKIASGRLYMEDVEHDGGDIAEVVRRVSGRDPG